MMATNSPRSTDSETPLSASTSPLAEPGSA